MLRIITFCQFFRWCKKKFGRFSKTKILYLLGLFLWKKSFLGLIRFGNDGLGPFFIGWSFRVFVYMRSRTRYTCTPFWVNTNGAHLGLLSSFWAQKVSGCSFSSIRVSWPSSLNRTLVDSRKNSIWNRIDDLLHLFYKFFHSPLYIPSLVYILVYILAF